MFKHKELKYWSLNVQVKVSDKDNPAYVNVEEGTCQLYVNAEKWRLLYITYLNDYRMQES